VLHVIMARLLVLCELVRLLATAVLDYGAMAKRSLLVPDRVMLPLEIRGSDIFGSLKIRHARAVGIEWYLTP